MSRINGEKARAALELKRRTARRVKDRALRAEWMKAQPEKSAPVVAAAPAAAKPKRKAEMSPDALIESLRPTEKKPRAKSAEPSAE